MTDVRKLTTPEQRIAQLERRLGDLEAKALGRIGDRPYTWDRATGDVAFEQELRAPRLLVPQGGNLLLNGTFEYGDLRGWHVTNQDTQTVTVSKTGPNGANYYSGAHYLNVEWTGLPASQVQVASSPLALADGSIPAGPGHPQNQFDAGVMTLRDKTLTVSARVGKRGTSGGAQEAFRLRVFFYNRDGNYIASGMSRWFTYEELATFTETDTGELVEVLMHTFPVREASHARVGFEVLPHDAGTSTQSVIVDEVTAVWGTTTPQAGRGLTFVNGWGDYGGTWELCRADRIGNLVVLSGLAKGVAAASTEVIAYLDDGYRPRGNQITLLGTSNAATMTRVDIYTDGRMQARNLDVGSTEWFTFTGLVFPAA